MATIRMHAEMKVTGQSVKKLFRKRTDGYTDTTDRCTGTLPADAAGQYSTVECILEAYACSVLRARSGGEKVPVWFFPPFCPLTIRYEMLF